MEGERWKTLSPLLDDLLELNGRERQQRLAMIQATDPGLAADLSKLMELEEERPDFMITVFAENQRPLTLEVGDNAPALEGGLWSASSQPKEVDKKTWNSMIGKDPWVVQRKFVIDYADGTQRTLHQLSVVTQVMRLGLLEKVTGQKLLQPAKQ